MKTTIEEINDEIYEGLLEDLKERKRIEKRADFLNTLEDFVKTREAEKMAFRSLKAWEKVIDAVKNLDEHDYCRCEGVNIPPMIDKEDVLTIIKMNLCEVEDEQTER